MLKMIANFFLEAVRTIIGLITLLVVGIPMALFGRGKGGPYAMVLLLLAPIVVLHVLGLGRRDEESSTGRGW